MRNEIAFWSVAKEFRRVLIFWTTYFKAWWTVSKQPELQKRSYTGWGKRSAWNSLFLYYYQLIVVLFSIGTIVSLLLPHPVLPEKPKEPKSIGHYAPGWERSWFTLSWIQYAVTAPPEFATHHLTLHSIGNTKMDNSLPSKAHSLGAALCAVSYDAGLNCECHARTGRRDVTFIGCLKC